MRIDLKDRVYGKLTVICRNGATNAGQAKWLCKCECGKETTVAGHSLTSGNTASCGCLRSESGKSAHTTHGMSKTRTYRIWQAMMRRCYDKEFISYVDYGGKGIEVVSRWHKFESFFEDMGVCPDKLTLDRKESSENYCKDNCRWADRVTQTRNRKQTVNITYQGETKPLATWAESIGLQRATLYRRIFVNGWTVETAIETPKCLQRGRESRGTSNSKGAKANHAVNVAVLKGELQRPSTCQHPGCSSSDVEGHHHNGYVEDKWLDVVWLCPAHHPKPFEIMVEYEGKKQSIRMWSQQTGLPRPTLYGRLKRCGWKADASTFRPLAEKRGRLLTLNGETHNIKEWSAIIGISMPGILARLKRGLPIEDVLTPKIRGG